MWQSWISLIVGLWMVSSGIVGTLASRGNFVVAGALLAIFGFWSTDWRGVIIGIVGLWGVLSGILPALTGRGNMWISGILAVIFAVWQAIATTRQHRLHEPTPGPV